MAALRSLGIRGGLPAASILPSGGRASSRPSGLARPIPRQSPHRKSWSTRLCAWNPSGNHENFMIAMGWFFAAQDGAADARGAADLEDHARVVRARHDDPALL